MYCPVKIVKESAVTLHMKSIGLLLFAFAGHYILIISREMILI